MLNHLNLYAGQTALKVIQQQGLTPQLFSSFLGASGGPKWFTLFGLDQYLFGEFFSKSDQEILMLGSSAGAYRSACFGQKDPIAAIKNLAKHYSELKYDKSSSRKDASKRASELVDILFGETGVQEVINNPRFKAHFVVAKSYGLVSFENRVLQGVGLIGSMLNNRRSRLKLRRQYERYIFEPRNTNLKISDPDNIPTRHVNFTERNIKQALLASGAIPMVMEGVKNIPDSPLGTYRDGGVLDYHFDLRIDNPGLTLYPHFSASLKPGWFDKNSQRQVRATSYDKTLLLCPSPQFVESLPYQKIPDRTDFVEIDREQRLKYWRQVFSQSEQLAQDLDQLMQNQWVNEIKPIEQLIANN